ncbi:glycolate oxidase subunit GlcF [Microbulbifer thermotolerans]|uniref:Glycolate oxidase iron-sulfur subunit n=2 Tax=Microbulbifer thermotolerans TaxID=252514 RepID=A0A143HP47_MICTH|nr:glycolate oxidase subunit GlcF [Microbulbifer thermotolerans]AMX03489.1 glycolate oxidase iron-sulfur subunit [Microbulbifer thermotolerans]MCX2780644.1 glycolate oxidase subunit GlcF [Microbulbifer thermotolerans]MCX2795357.1 glycolate oxidase subunit GlcF [Microbulbifer thermotolerans]MCX2802429.1 glycolate oxidase subunit GlcF [Microbulbifer thermotolerans]MCX2806185.1 glycolate oxidase subunit GlcF [Microbulbifer thermotolerans]
MQTNLVQQFAKTQEGQEAEAILRACVHCGFCTATCPTYQELHDERDGPRGRIYLMKMFLEGAEITEKTREHLDRCLTCRSCETTCPSGVQYGRLVDISRGLIEKQLPRKPIDRWLRWGLARVLPRRRLFGSLLRIGQLFRPLLPNSLRRKVPPKKQASPWPKVSHQRKVLALAGCVQPSATPNTNAAAARVLDKLGITMVEAPQAGCCGAVNYHLSEHEQALAYMRRNIDAWWPAIEAGAEAIIMTASGCGAMVQDYGHLLKDDPAYAERAKKVSELCTDLGAFLLQQDLEKLHLKQNPGKVAFHCPCTLQHAMQQSGVVEQVLTRAGIDLAETRDKHLCCGSAGTYSVLQPKLSQRLLEKKLDALMVGQPDRIVTANIGCQMHLESQAEVPVQHWIELLDTHK